MPKTVKDKIRGCGWRKPGGLYLKSSSMFSTCGKLPLEIEVCSCCGAGIKPARGWTWNENALIDISIPVKSILKIERALATLDLTLDPRLKAPPDQEDNAGHEAYDSEPKPA